MRLNQEGQTVVFDGKKFSIGMPIKAVGKDKTALETSYFIHHGNVKYVTEIPLDSIVMSPSMLKEDTRTWHRVVISELLQMTVDVLSEGKQEEEIVEQNWNHGEHILGSDDFVKVKFSAKEKEMEHIKDNEEVYEENEEDLEI